MSHRLWQQRFGGAPAVLGQRLTINRVPFTIVGVAANGFHGPEVGEAMDLFLPLAAEAAIRGRDSALDWRSSWWLQIGARLKTDQSAESAAAALNAARPAIREATMPPDYSAEYRARYLNDEMSLQLASRISAIVSRRR